MSSQCAGDSGQRKRGCVTRTWKESAIGNENTIDSYAWSGMCRSRKKRERHRGLGLHDSQAVNIFLPNFFGYDNGIGCGGGKLELGPAIL